MNYVDIAIIIIIGISVVTALFRGLIKEAISLGVWIMAIWAATVYAPKLSYLLSNYISSPTIQVSIMYSLLGLAVLLVGALFNALIGLFISKSGLGSMDTLLGAIFGFARGCLIVSLILLVIRVVGMPTGDLLANSVLAQKFNPLVNWLYQYVPNLNQLTQLLNNTTNSVSAQSATEQATKILLTQ